MAENGAIATSATEAVSTIPCTICRRQFSRYSCPRCNIPYCSLLCFRSEAHGECSEAFYRQELEQEARSDPTKTVEEKRRMIELLKRFEENSLEDSPLLDDEDEDEDTDDLQRRLQNLDIDSASYDQLWDMLKPDERAKFLRALDDPTSELAQQLLASSELENDRSDPWWMAPEASHADTDTEEPSPVRPRPPITVVPSSLVSQLENSTNVPLLLYNVCAVCIAYCYIVRHFAIPLLGVLLPSNAEHDACRREISQIVPFLTDRRSKTLHTSLSSVVTDIWSRFTTGYMTPTFFAVLLRDAATLLRPVRAIVLPSPDPLAPAASTVALDAHPHAEALRMLSDLSTLFSASSPSQPPAKQKVDPVVQKLTFYMAYVVGTPSALMQTLADEVALRAQQVESEMQAEIGSDGDVRRDAVQMGPKIEA